MDFHPIPTRDMIELPVLDAKDLEQDQVYNEIENRVKTIDIIDKIARLKIINIPQHVYNSLDFRKITELKSNAFHFDLRFERKDEKEKAFTTETTISKLPLDRLKYIHMAGHDQVSPELIIDTHGQPIIDPVYDLFEWTVKNIAPVPVLLERDFNIPEMYELTNELNRLQSIMDKQWTAEHVIT